MTREHFKLQLGRLESQWPNSYGDERKGRLWLAFQNVPDEDFTRAVDFCLDESRSAPLVPELSKSVERAKYESTQSRVSRGYGMEDPASLLKQAAVKDKETNKELVQRCLAHLQDFKAGKISMEHFQQGCDLLDRAADLINPTGKKRTVSSCGTTALHYRQGEKND